MKPNDLAKEKKDLIGDLGESSFSKITGQKPDCKALRSEWEVRNSRQ